jgi:hypothetical protein
MLLKWEYLIRKSVAIYEFKLQIPRYYNDSVVEFLFLIKAD